MMRHPFVFLPLAAIGALATACDGGVARSEAGEVVASTTVAEGARDDADALLALLPASETRDPAVRAARDALAADAPWRAAVALAPALGDPARRTPTVTLLAAVAAAAREEWTTVDRLVASLPDSTAFGFAPLLAARSALARNSGATGADATTRARQALDAARRSAAHAPDGVERGVRLALVARSLDRLATEAAGAALADSARAAYRAAAAALPSVSDWLALRAAGVTRDSAERARTYAGLRLAAARERVPATEAESRERAGDRAGAAVAYAAAGRRVKALSLRLADAGVTEAARTAIRDSLVRIVTAQSGTGEARLAVELLDATFGTLTPAEELAVARSAAASGPGSRAVSAFSRALAAGLGTQRDRYSYATLLGRTGRTSDAMAEFARVRAAGGSLAGDAAYQRARLLLRARSAGATAALQEVVTAFPADTAAAASALYLLADVAIDAGRDGDARAALLRLARQWPASDRAPRARFDAAIIALAGGDGATAARELDELRGGARGIDSTSRPEAIAAAYWAGRAAAAVGDRERARARWREVATRVPSSYYAMLAARRLGESPWRPAGSATPIAPPADVAAATARMALLERIGLDPEAGWEREALVRSASASAGVTRASAEGSGSAARMLAVAEALREAGATSSGMRLARRALDAGAEPTVAAYRVLYPWPWASLLRESARARGLDPTLAAAVIRQESSFTPGAVSPAGAVGLMQLMPPVGRSLWNALGAARADVPWSVALLRQPDVNVALGTRHLASSMQRYPNVAYALAAYNAGGTPVARWRRRTGTDDPELFVERIPYEETRDYVRIVTRNQAFYQALYGGG